MGGGSPQDTSILVIDDDSDVLTVFCSFLQSEGYRVTGKSSGESGLAALGKASFDIVITDLRMPGMSGLDVLRRVKEKSPETEVLVVTGHATIHDGVQAMREGAYDFLLKPVGIAELETTLGRCLQWIRYKRSHAELEVVNRKLVELGRMKDRFLAVADHELRTPVTVLDGMLHLLIRQNSDLPEKVRSRLESLRQVSSRLVGLVRDIHDIVESRSNGFRVELDWAEAEKVNAGVNLDFELARFGRNLDLQFDSEISGDVRIKVDVNRLRQAITELIQNAVTATPDGGQVRVLIFKENRDQGPRFCVSVSDTGVGIPEKDRDRILEAFHGLGDERHHHTSKFDFMGSGLGLGLTLVLEIAKAHGGGLDFVSEEGRGSTFTLWIPSDQTS